MLELGVAAVVLTGVFVTLLLMAVFPGLVDRIAPYVCAALFGLMLLGWGGLALLCWLAFFGSLEP